MPIAANTVMTPFLIHGLGLHRWGLYTLASSVSLFLGPFDLGLGGATGRYFALYAGQDDQVNTTRTFLTLGLVLSVLASVVVALSWVLAPVVTDLFHVGADLRSESVFLLRCLGILSAIGLFQGLVASLLSSRLHYSYLAAASTATYVVWVAGATLSVVEHHYLYGIGIVLILQVVVGTAALVPLAKRYLVRSGMSLLSWAETSQLVKFGLSIQAMNLVGLANSEVDNLLVGGLFNLRTLAFFNAGANLSMQVRNLSFNALSPMGNQLSRAMGRGGETAALRALGQLQALWVVFSTGLTAVALGCAYFSVIEWLGNSFKLGGEVAVVAMAASLVNLWTGTLTQYLSAVGRPDLEVRYAVGATGLNLALTVPLALLFGPLGVVSATAIGAVLSSLYLRRIVRVRHRRDVPGFLHHVPLGSAALSLLVTVALEVVARPWAPTGASGLLWSLLPGLAGATIYLLMLSRGRIVQLLRALTRRDFDVDLLLRCLPAVRL